MSRFRWSLHYHPPRIDAVLRRTLVRAVAISILVVCGVAAAGDLAIYHIDVGQGDATLIVSPEGKTLLIDAGNTGKGNQDVVPLLQSLDIAELDYVMATHFDADHIGGLDEVLLTIGKPRLAVLDHGQPFNPDKTKSFRDYVQAAGAKRRTIKVDERLDLGEGLTVQCVAVNGCIQGGCVTDTDRLDENGTSVALRLKYGKFDYFIGGDLTGGGKSGSRRTADVESLVASRVGDVDVLHVNHHGSETSSNETFLKALRPEVVVISVGNGGSNAATFRHPRRKVLDRLEDLDSLKAIFLTNRGETVGGLKPKDKKFVRVADGHVVIHTDGKKYTVNNQTYAVDKK